MTIGYANGVITIGLAESAESNAAYREKMRIRLGEPYRTMLGHLRHEVGHYIEALHVPGRLLKAGKKLFGDDALGYQNEIDRHYEDGPPDGWETDDISSYATMHPYEDFAETFAHYLHITDTVETAWVHRLLDADLAAPFRQILTTVWIPLSIGLNPDQQVDGQGRPLPLRDPDDRHGQARLRRVGGPAGLTASPTRPPRPEPRHADRRTAAQPDPRD